MEWKRNNLKSKPNISIIEFLISMNNQLSKLRIFYSKASNYQKDSYKSTMKNVDLYSKYFINLLINTKIAQFSKTCIYF